MLRLKASLSHNQCDRHSDPSSCAYTVGCLITCDVTFIIKLHRLAKRSLWHDWGDKHINLGGLFNNSSTLTTRWRIFGCKTAKSMRMFYHIIDLIAIALYCLIENHKSFHCDCFAITSFQLKGNYADFTVWNMNNCLNWHNLRLGLAAWGYISHCYHHTPKTISS